MWEMARNIAADNGCGDIGASENEKPNLNFDISDSAPPLLLGFLELYKKTNRKEFLRIAQKIGDNIVHNRFHKGFFVPTSKHLYAKFDAVEPLVLLHLDGAIKAKTDVVPQFWPTRSYFHCPYDGMGRTYDNKAIYSRTAP